MGELPVIMGRQIGVKKLEMGEMAHEIWKMVDEYQL
jgi:hypothetical protein